jgi:hypothetical protein
MQRTLRPQHRSNHHSAYCARACCFPAIRHCGECCDSRSSPITASRRLSTEAAAFRCGCCPSIRREPKSAAEQRASSWSRWEIAPRAVREITHGSALCRPRCACNDLTSTPEDARHAASRLKRGETLLVARSRRATACGRCSETGFSYENGAVRVRSSVLGSTREFPGTPDMPKSAGATENLHRAGSCPAGTHERSSVAVRAVHRPPVEVLLETSLPAELIRRGHRVAECVVVEPRASARSRTVYESEVVTRQLTWRRLIGELHLAHDFSRGGERAAGTDPGHKRTDHAQRSDHESRSWPHWNPPVRRWPEAPRVLRSQAPHQLRHAHAVQMSRGGIPLLVSGSSGMQTSGSCLRTCVGSTTAWDR